MTAECIRALVGIGFEWGTTKTDLASVWNEQFQELREFKAQFRHCTVPKRHFANPKLGRWVVTQRSTYRKNTEGRLSPMTAERIQALDGIGFECETTAVFRSEQSVV
jgi:hypothetical protein